MFWLLKGKELILAIAVLYDNSFTSGIASQFRHSKWEGFTFWDLIAPMFMFIVGISMTYSIGKRIEKGARRKDLFLQIIRRTVLLFIFGLIMNDLLEFNFSELRIWGGTLQRIALCYCIGGIIFLTNRVRGVIAWSLGLLLFDWAVMTLVPVPGVGAGVLTPAGNLAGYLDRMLIFGRMHGYGHGDYLGVITTLPCTTATTFGALCGHYLRKHAHSPHRKTVMILAAGVICLIVGGLWGMIYPMNRALWSASYMLYSNGWSLVFFAVFYYVIDVRGYSKWAFPFILIGLNAITIYLVQSQFNFGIIARIFVRGIMGHMGVLEPVFFVLCVILVKLWFLYFLYKKRIFLRV